MIRRDERDEAVRYVLRWWPLATCARAYDRANGCAFADDCDGCPMPRPKDDSKEKTNHGAALLELLRPHPCTEPPDPHAVYYDMRPVVRHAEALIAAHDAAIDRAEKAEADRDEYRRRACDARAERPWSGYIIEIHEEDALIEFGVEHDALWLPLVDIPEQSRKLGAHCCIEWSTETWTNDEIERARAAADAALRTLDNGQK